MQISPQGSTADTAGWEVPLEMLAACHARMQQQFELLQRLLRHLQEHGADSQAGEACERIQRYFETAARDHHQDEEQDLLPALLEAMAGSDAVCIRDIIARLGAEHRVLEQRWLALRDSLQAVQAGDASALQPQQVQAFVAAYRQHIDYEQAEVLPMAERLLDDEQLQRIGRAMRLRRGAAEPPPAR